MPGFRAAAIKKQSDSKRDFLLNSIFPKTELTGGEGIGSSKSSCAASVPETFDALETCELLGTLGGKDGTQLPRGVEISFYGTTGFVLGVFNGKGEPGTNCPSYDGARQEADGAYPH